MKLGTKVIGLVLGVLGIFALILRLASPASAATDMETEIRQGSVITVSTALQHDFSEWLVMYTGELDWSQINGTAGTTANTARMNELKAVTPMAMIEGTAYDITKWLGSTAYTGKFQLVSPDRAACLVGVLTNSFLAKYQVRIVQDELNTLQAMAYVQFDNPSLTVAQARQQLLTMSEWPKGAGGFELGLERGFAACGLSTTRAV